MSHETHRVVDFKYIEFCTLWIKFDDGTEQTIDFGPVLKGSLFGPLRDEYVFRQVEINPEQHTLVWPNGADFDPETLYNWPKYAEGMKTLATSWDSMSDKVA